MRQMTLGSLLVLASVLAAGCGPGYPIVTASGTITLDGEPLTNATIITQPIGSKENTTPGPGSIAETDENGFFELAFQHEDRMGAVPGKSRIKIVENGTKRASADDTAEVVRSTVPLDYQEGKAEYEIPAEGTDAMDFALESPRRRRR